ncbi:hypothetical protein L1887_47088 [Cichorium endivia]|nr:hypothetical protein L1887_47088 [Cichorium endivia]
MSRDSAVAPAILNFGAGDAANAGGIAVDFTDKTSAPEDRPNLFRYRLSLSLHDACSILSRPSYDYRSLEAVYNGTRSRTKGLGTISRVRRRVVLASQAQLSLIPSTSARGFTGVNVHEVIRGEELYTSAAKFLHHERRGLLSGTQLSYCSERRRPRDRGANDGHLQARDDLVGEGAGAELAAEVTRALAAGDGLEDGVLDAVGLVKEAHVTQHHDGRQQQRGRVGLVLASNVGRRAVDGLEDRGVLADVARGGEAETADETGAHVGENVTVQVGHDHDAVGVWRRVLDDAEAGAVEEVLVVGDVRVLLGDLSAGVEEHAVGHAHDGSLVDGGDLVAAVLLGVVEGVAGDALGSLVGDELDGLDHAVDDLVLDARVLALGVLTDEDGVDVVVGGLEALDGLAGTDVGEEAEVGALVTGMARPRTDILLSLSADEASEGRLASEELADRKAGAANMSFAAMGRATTAVEDDSDEHSKRDGSEATCGEGRGGEEEDLCLARIAGGSPRRRLNQSKTRPDHRRRQPAIDALLPSPSPRPSLQLALAANAQAQQGKENKKSKIQGGKARKKKRKSKSAHSASDPGEEGKKGEAAIFCVDVRMSKVNVDERHQTPSVPHRATILRCLRPLDRSYCRRCLLASTSLSFYRLSFVLKADNRPARTMKTRWCCCVE